MKYKIKSLYDNMQYIAQVPFSSLNFGTDTSYEGRLVTQQLLIATDEGLGNGETPIFPVSVFKIKKNVSAKPGDPNYDLFELACKVSAKRMFPNFGNVSASYNIPTWEGASMDSPDDEYATMGCVEGGETIRYKIDNVEYIEPFRVAYDRVKQTLNEQVYSKNTDYIDTSKTDIKIWDSSSNDFVQVKKFIRNRNVNDWNVIKFNKGYSLTATSDHPLPVIDKGRTFVKDLKVGDKIPVSKYSDYSGNELRTEYFGNKAWLLGVILADSAYSSSQITISLGLDEKDIVDAIKSDVEDLGYRLHIKEQHRGSKGDYYDVSIREIPGLKYAREELSELFGGYNKKDRRVSDVILRSSRDSRISFLAGLIDADGHIGTSNNRDGSDRSAKFVLDSTNKELALTELELIRGLGYKAKLYRNHYSTRHNKIRYLIEFEIVDEVADELK